jgi:Carboxypeptidase regulatory-like domain/TonB-dependent Receptor Plug Domain
VRKSLIALCVLLLSVGLVAQQRTGNIFGKVTDPEGNALPGVTVTLSGLYTAGQTTVSSAEGNFRFLSLPPARDYSLKMELAGFKSRTETGIIVIVGGNTNLTLTMEVGVLEEQVTVTAVSPMVDTKKTQVGVNVTQEVLQSLPTARDPWVILQMAPSIIIDRENIGGNESGQQSNYVARGTTTYNNNVWAMDGIVITDPAAIGASPSYYDFDAFEEMQITTGGADVMVQTGGIALNMVTRRGGNKVSLGGRFYFVDEKFQAKNLDKVAELKKTEPYFLGLNMIRNTKDYGFNMGIPLLKDKAWFWMSYGIQDIKTNSIYQTPDDSLLENYVGKLNLQIIPQNRFEAFAHIGGKKKWGRSTSASNPEGLYQAGRYHFGSPIYKLQDEHMFGDNLFISLKYAYSDAGFSLTPMTDLNHEKLYIWDDTAQRAFGTQANQYYVERPVNQYNVLVNYFNDNLFGASHDVKIGFEYADRNQFVRSTVPSNMQVTRNFQSPQADFTGDGLPDVPPSNFYGYYFWRGYYADQNVSALSAYLQDTITFGRFNLILGLRWDQQMPSLNPFTVAAIEKDNPATKATLTPATIDLLDKMLPGVQIPQTDVVDVKGNKWGWKIFSPRLGLTWDMFGDGKTLLKLSGAMYGDFLGTGTADWARPGGTSGWVDTYWWDGNKDGMVDFTELYWYNYRKTPYYKLYRIFNDAGQFTGDWNDAAGQFWGGYEYQNPGKTVAPYGSQNEKLNTQRTWEALLTLDKELFNDFSVSLIGTYRKYTNFNWNLKYFLGADGTTRNYQTKDMWVSAGKPDASYPGVGDTKEASKHEWYYASTAYTAYSPYTERQPMPDRYQDYFGFDFVLNKRLSNRWMANANFTWQTQADHYNGAYFNPTNVWAYDGKPQAAYIGGASGKMNQYTYTRWMFKAGGLYQLPFDIDISGTFNMREGWVINEFFTLYDYRLPNPASRNSQLVMANFGDNRLPLFYNLTLRLEKMIKLGDTGRIYVMADLFNVLNLTIENRRDQKNHGTYYVYPNASQNKYVKYNQYYALNEIINPRVMRVGVRFTF